MSTTPMSLEQFGQTVKAKHPEYADMNDAELGQKVLAKYPQYQDMVATPKPSIPPQIRKAMNLAPSQEDVASSVTGFEGGGGTGIGDVAAGYAKGVGRTLLGAVTTGAPIVGQVSSMIDSYNKLAKSPVNNPITNNPVTRALQPTNDTQQVAGLAGELHTNLGAMALDPALTRQTAGAVPKRIAGAMAESRATAVRSVVPEAANLPATAINGAEDLFRASAPTGTNTQFRGNLYAAAGDLSEIGQKINLAEAKGGVIQPDMRVRASVNAINEHLSEMYQNELLPQIARNAQVQTVPRFSADAMEGLNYLSRNAGPNADRTLASNLSNAQSVSLSDLNNLRQVVNRELAPLRGMTPQELAVAEGNSRRMASLQALDKEVGQTMAGELQRRGEVGVAQYERRYAGLSEFRDQLQSRMNAAELQRSTAPQRWIRGLAGGPKGIASASQASVADVNTGKMLQRGFNSLASSQLTANRGTATAAPRVAGLLGEGNIQLPSQMEPIGALGLPPKALPYQPSLQQPRQMVWPSEIRPSPVEGNMFRDLLPQPQGPLFDALIKKTRVRSPKNGAR